MKKKLLVVVAATVVASSAMAQSAFEGFYGQLGVGYENNSFGSRTLDVSAGGGHTGTGGALSAPSSSGGGFSGAIGLGYNLSVAPQWLIGIGADYSPTSTTTSTQLLVTCSGCDGTNNYKVNNRYSVYLTPGYEVDKDKLVYLKAGYSGENVTWQPQGTAASVASQSKTASGYVVGLGYKQLIDKNIYVFGEGNYYSYSSNNVSSTSGSQAVTQAQTPSAYQFLVGLGYKF
ncbi:outer membrane protein [Polynucleobacter paneuropaeus]|uniref:outer membrane protein n=1 Tax=Polynucleobacter paneuropaeus TaxID=2527775 RepID=UPI001BFD0220|nr:outer membrane beta-barrel protein [Polynucleobacter paneuropaeus]MBT8622756.1 outer membrane beta-barrel protein [Polynucleobacter paneuropaeus]